MTDIERRIVDAAVRAVMTMDAYNASAREDGRYRMPLWAEYLAAHDAEAVRARSIPNAAATSATASTPPPAATAVEDFAEHPLSGLHISRGSMNAAADAYERDYYADLLQHKATRDEQRGCLMPVGYYVRDAIGRLQERLRAAAGLIRPRCAADFPDAAPQSEAADTARLDWLEREHWTTEAERLGETDTEARYSVRAPWRATLRAAIDSAMQGNTDKT